MPCWPKGSLSMCVAITDRDGRQGTARMAGAAQNEDAVHRAGKSMGERVLRELQRETQGRVPQAGDPLQPERGSGCDRRLARSLQPGAAPLIVGLPAACARYTGGHRTTATHSHNHAVSSQLAWSKIPVRSPACSKSYCKGTRQREGKITSRWTASMEAGQNCWAYIASDLRSPFAIRSLYIIEAFKRFPTTSFAKIGVT
jgi:hypothetical protein